MTIALHEIYPAQFVYAGPTTLYLNQLEQVDVQPGIELLEAMAAGSVDPELIATAFAEPKVEFTSRDISTILAGVPFATGRDITTSAKIQYQKRLDGGVYTSGSAHFNLTATLGYLYLKEFGAKQDDKQGADIMATFCPKWDGTNLPLVANVNQALAGTPAANAVHSLGPVVFEGALLEGVQSSRVKTGIEVMFKRAGGELFSRVCTISKRKASMEIEVLNCPFAATLTVGTTYPISSGITAYLQKVVPGGGRVAVGTAEHISATVSAGTYTVTGITGTGGDNGNVKFSVHPTGNNISISAAAAIVIP